MKITHIELKDWGPHKHISADTGAGVLGVIGSNGSGKSNLLQAIDYAFTGNLNGRTGASYIRNCGMEDGATKAVVRVAFEKDGKKGEITREVMPKSSKRKLVWDGSTYTRADDVESVIQDILGTDKAALANAAFIKQGSIANLVQGTPSERNDIFRKLIQLGFVDKRSDDLMARSASLESCIVDYTEMKASLTEKLGPIEESVAAAEKDVAEYGWAARLDVLHAAKSYVDQVNAMYGQDRKVAAMMEELVSLKDKLALLARDAETAVGITADKIEAAYDESVGLLADAKSRLSEAESMELLLSQHEDAKAKLAEMTSEFNKAVSERDSLHNPAEGSINSVIIATRLIVDKLQRIVDAHKSYVAAVEKEGSLKIEKEAADKKLAAEAPVMLKAVEQTRRALSGANSKLDLFKGLRQAMEGNGGEMPDKCPCCGQSLSSVVKAMSPEEVNNRIALLEKRIANDNKFIAEYEACIRRLESDAATKSSRLDAASEAAKAAAGELNAANIAYQVSFDDDPPANMEAAGKELSKQSGKLASLQKKVSEYDEACSKVVYIGNKVKGLEGRVATLDNMLGSNDTSLAGKSAELKEEVATHTARIERLKEYKARYSSCKKSVDDCEASIATMRAVLEEHIEKCSEARHSEAVEAIVTHADDDLVSQNYWPTETDMILGVAEHYDGMYKDRLKEHDTLVGSANALKKELASINERIEENKKKVVLISDLRKVRELVGKNGVPLSYMNSVFKSISIVVQDLLRKMNANFTVEPDPNTPVTFKFTRTDDESGYAMSQDQLSGGQAIRLALALLIACQQVVLPEMGLLVLDEPSSHIDDEGIASMRDMFADLGEVMDSADMQLIVVDHNVNLMSAFGGTIKLGQLENP